MKMSNRQKIAAEIRSLAERVQSWNSADEKRWAELTAEYDAEYAQERVRNATGNNPLIGRDQPGALSQGPHNPEAFGHDPADDSAIALCSWMRNQSGFPVAADHYNRAVNAGVHPSAGTIQFNLPTGSPTLGLNFQQPMNAQSGQLGTGGGFTISSGLLSRLEKQMKFFGPMLQTSEVWVTTHGRETGWPTLDDTDNEGSQVGENADVGDATDLTFGARLYRAYKQTTGVLKAPFELLRDSEINMSNTIIDALGERLGRQVNTKTTNGIGAGTVTGLMTQVPTGKTGASQTTVTMDELIELQHAVDPAYRNMPGVGWMLNDSTVSVVRRLKDGDGAYLWRDSVQEGQPARLLGYPAFINPKMDDLGAGLKPIVFGHLPHYKIRIVTGVRMRTLTERYAEFDQTGFIGFIEIDGGLLKPSATDSLCPIQAFANAA